MKSKAILVTLLAHFLVVNTALPADDAPTKPALRVVFFTPADVDPPEGVRERLKEHVDYAQAFFTKWMKHWGYECKSPLPVNRDKDGYPEILFVKGKHTEASGRYSKLGFQSEVVKTACQKYALKRQGEVWWIFMYKGPKSNGFRGGGNSHFGGTSTAIYDPSRKGHLRPKAELGGEEAGKLQAKAAIHELGHALGLPHIGPLDKDKLGNSLMGPITPAYRKRHGNETRVYLSKAAAAMLWKHPLFSGSTKDRDKLPTLAFDNLRATFDKASSRLTVSGHVETNYSAHNVVIGCESKTTRGGYWTKTFVGQVAEDGTFQVEIDEILPKDGHLRTACCFNNGAVIGKDGGRRLEKGFVMQYTFTDGVFMMGDGWGN